MLQETINTTAGNEVSNPQTVDVSALLAQISNPAILKALMGSMSAEQIAAIKSAEKETAKERAEREAKEKEAAKAKEEQVIATSEKVSFCLRAYYQDAEGKEKSYWRELKNDFFNNLGKLYYLNSERGNNEFRGVKTVVAAVLQDVDFSAFYSVAELNAIAASFTAKAKELEKIEKEAAKEKK